MATVLAISGLKIDAVVISREVIWPENDHFIYFVWNDSIVVAIFQGSTWKGETQIKRERCFDSAKHLWLTSAFS